jgi:hypothetical protein
MSDRSRQPVHYANQLPKVESLIVSLKGTGRLRSSSGAGRPAMRARRP